jgi:hypothetical protein
VANSDRLDPDRERLSSQAAERLLARAAELDSHQRSTAEVASLRAAAAEAGIHPEAFDAALAEMRARETGVAAPAPPLVYGPSRRRNWIMVGATLALIVGIGLSRLFPSQRAVDRVAPRAAPPASATPALPAGTIEHTFELRCLTASQAVAFLRPVLTGAEQVILPPETRSHILVVRALPDRMAVVRSVLDQHDPRACKIPAAPR